METTKNTAVKPAISKSAFTTDVNNGLSKSELTTKYGISDVGLTIKRALVPKYTLVDDVVITPTAETMSAFSLNN